MTKGKDEIRNKKGKTNKTINLEIIKMYYTDLPFSYKEKDTLI